ncbi:MAG: hypothetical protein DMF56_25455 [Acidobacteria bacterium]|nr:MAG: hypothetical protein DMF56_25455 [Acidobacteriota bacterium]
MMSEEITMNAKRSRQSKSRQRGAALIITVIVIMVLSILGMSMVTFTTTEERTATSYRDGLQARAVAEAGVHMVEEMFRDPTNRDIVPKYSSNVSDCGGGTPAADYCGTDEGSTETSLNAIGIWRSARPAPISPSRYTGINNKFFLGPFKDAWGQTFGGTYATGGGVYDLKLDCTNPATPNGTPIASTTCWLDKNINTPLLGWSSTAGYNANAGKITDISFYAAPSDAGYQYGICTVRVTAVKTQNGVVVARETLEAVIGDNSRKPAVFGNGPVTFDVNLCGDGCEQIFANGNGSIGNVIGSAGTPPILSVAPPGTTASPSGSNTTTGATPIVSPYINPWDLSYKPVTTAGLSKYFLATARPLDAVWTDGDPNTPADKSPRVCGLSGLALCQDYNLEYTAGATPAAKPARTAGDTPYMYKWDIVNKEWSATGCTSGATLNCGVASPSFIVAPANDLIDGDATDAAGKVDNADIPFNKFRVAKTTFEIDDDYDGATILVDGRFFKHGSFGGKMSIIAVGSLYLHSSTHYWNPALENRVLWVTGRDIHTHSNCCAPSNVCLTNLTHPESAGIMATHEQFSTESQNAMLGVILAENRINLDNEVDSTIAIFNDNGDHGSLCGLPDWPWSVPTVPKIFSMKSVPE